MCWKFRLQKHSTVNKSKDPKRYTNSRYIYIYTYLGRVQWISRVGVVGNINHNFVAQTNVGLRTRPSKPRISTKLVNATLMNYLSTDNPQKVHLSKIFCYVFIPVFFVHGKVHACASAIPVHTERTCVSRWFCWA